MSFLNIHGDMKGSAGSQMILIVREMKIVDDDARGEHFN